MHANPGKKNAALVISLAANLGVLGYFKYAQFFMESLQSIVSSLGYQLSSFSLEVVLPVGISFYTFQTISYTIDVYREKTTPTKSLLNFAAYVSFFPQLVAGPIERASRFLPQIESPTVHLKKLPFFKLIVWGLFKKVVIADQLAPIVDSIFSSPASYSSLDLLAGIFLFGIQIYGDFSGYSDIAIGIAGLMGFQLMSNFRFPYFSHHPVDFWRRWHISLSTWFRDYVYIPLGGSKKGTRRTVIAVIVVFLVSGLWHGANYTFILWGAYHAILFLLVRKWVLNLPYNLLTISITFVLINLGWLLFRVEDFQHLLTYVDAMTGGSFYLSVPFKALFWVAVLFVLDLWSRKDERDPLPMKSSLWIQFGVLSLMIVLIINHFGSNQHFIYFQF
jgi:D-alanyl-lipoteichoic acid acyltransferase DltB (MBOAT superfamily)